VALELGPPWDCAPEIVTAAGAVPLVAEPSTVPPAVVAPGGAAKDAAAAAADAAVDAGGGEELPDTGNGLPDAPPADDLLAAALRVGLEASCNVAAKSLPLVFCAEELA
jgi:hypothetical protein